MLSVVESRLVDWEYEMLGVGCYAAGLGVELRMAVYSATAGVKVAFSRLVLSGVVSLCWPLLLILVHLQFVLLELMSFGSTYGWNLQQRICDVCRQ